MPAEGSRAAQITRDGGLAAVESADGYLYYSTQINQKKGVWRVPVSGGQETLATDAVRGWQDWDLTDRGIYITDSSLAPATLLYSDFAAKSARSLARISTDPTFAAGGVRVSADGK